MARLIFYFVVMFSQIFVLPFGMIDLIQDFSFSNMVMIILNLVNIYVFSVLIDYQQKDILGLPYHDLY